MSPRVNTEDLVDATQVAGMLGLTHRNSVSVYLKRYPDMPRPVLDLGQGRPRLWIRQEIERWCSRRRDAGSRLDESRGDGVLNGGS